MPKRKPTQSKAPEVCPVCGEAVPAGSLACPECGPDHNSGWRDGAETFDDVDLPDEDFDYGEFVKKEFGGSYKPTGIRMVWWIAGILLIIAFAMLYF